MWVSLALMVAPQLPRAAKREAPCDYLQAFLGSSGVGIVSGCWKMVWKTWNKCCLSMELPWCGAGGLSAALGKVLNPFGLIQLPGGRSHLAVRCLQLPRMGKNLPLSFQQLILIFFLLEWWAHPFPSPQQEQNVTAVSRQSSEEVHPLSGGRVLEKYSSLPPVCMVKAKSRLSQSVPD